MTMQAIEKLLTIAYDQNRKDHDTVFCIVGPEGSSKSTLALHMIDTWEGLRKKEPDIGRIGLDVDQFKRTLSTSSKLDIAVFDEAGDGMYSRQAISPMNILLNKTYMAIRGLNLLTVLVLPDFFDLDTFFRKRRVRGLFFVYRRGRCMFFNSQQIQEIIGRCENARKIFGVSPSIYDTFPKYKGPLARTYKKLKDAKMKESLKGLGDYTTTGASKKDIIMALISNGMNANQAAKSIGCSTTYGYKVKEYMDSLKP